MRGTGVIIICTESDSTKTCFCQHTSQQPFSSTSNLTEHKIGIIFLPVPSCFHTPLLARFFFALSFSASSAAAAARAISASPAVGPLLGS